MLKIETSKLTISPSVYIGYYDNNNDEEQQNDVKFEAWVNEHKTETDKFDYILSVDVKDEATKDYLIGNGWVYNKHLGDKRNLRGYKLNH